jgi:hypothetical protein
MLCYPSFSEYESCAQCTSVRSAALLVSQNQHDAPHTSVSSALPSTDETVRSYHHISSPTVDSWTSSSLFDRSNFQGVQMKTEPIHFAALHYWTYCSVFTERYFSSYISRWRRGLRRGSEASRLLVSWVRIPPGGHRCLSLVAVVCCQIEVSATGSSLVQRRATDCGVSWVWSWSPVRGGHGRESGRSATGVLEYVWKRPSSTLRHA